MERVEPRGPVRPDGSGGGLLDVGAHINGHNPRIGSPVTWPPRLGALLSRLLERGGDPSLTPDSRLRPLMVPALQGNLLVVSVLLAHGADPARRNRAGPS